MSKISKIKNRIKKMPVLSGIAHSIHQPLVQLKVSIKRVPIYLAETKVAEKQLSQCDGEKRIFYCGVPTHNNLGDQAQAYCIRKWISENYNEYKVVELTAWPFYSKKIQKQLKNIVGSQDIFVIQSGYCTTESHYNHYMHRFLAKEFKNNAILFMPQTVNFHKEKEGYKTGEIYGAHSKLLFLARDKFSFDLSRKYFKKTPIELYPDIVTSLIGDFPISNHKHKSGILICVRNDGEKLYSNEEIGNLQRKFQELRIDTRITDTNFSNNIDDKANSLENMIKSKIDEFASYEVVITDRYHGTIFSLIANTPVIVLATRDHKVKTGTEWFNGIYEGAFYNADTLEQAYLMALRILEDKPCIDNTAYFKEKYYIPLKEKFASAIKHIDD